MSFWNYFQALQINDNDRKASNAEIKSNRNTRDVRVLEDKIDALALVTQAMWEILNEKTDVTLKQLEHRVEEIDLRDGKLDGKMSSNITKCPDCGHKVNQRHTNCFWCGARVKSSIIK